MRAALALAALLITPPAEAANFSIGAFAGNIPIIDVSGVIELGDDGRFAFFANALQFAVVRLDSRGGQASAAINMGLAIRSKRFATYVSPGHLCASACGLIWLAGEPRGKDVSAMVGFHGVFLPVNGKNEPTGPGNAAVGAYMNSLHYGMDAIMYVTAAPPDQMSWLTPESAKAYGIAYDSRDEVETSFWPKPSAVVASIPTPQVQPAPVPAPQQSSPLQLPSATKPVEPQQEVAALPPPPKHKPRPPMPQAPEQRGLPGLLSDLLFGPPQRP